MKTPNQSDWSHFPDIHPATAAAFDEISKVRYPSDAKKIARRAGRLVTEHHIPLTEMEAILTAGIRKARELSPHTPNEPEEIPLSEAPQTGKPWSPSDILERLPAEREPDWAERQLPRGDRE